MMPSFRAQRGIFAFLRSSLLPLRRVKRNVHNRFQVYRLTLRSAGRNFHCASERTALLSSNGSIPRTT